MGHPIIHLGYAFEMDSREMAMEALGLAATQYNFFHKYLDRPVYTRPSPLEAESPLELLIQMAKDKRFDSLPKDPALADLETIFDEHEGLIMEYWNGWKIDNPVKQFELSQEAAVAVFVSTVRPGTHAYNFLLVHLLTTSHAVRILLPFLPQEHHVTLVREWWLLVIAMFIFKGRPMPDPDNIEEDLKGNGWSYVEDRALNSPWATDAHYVKGMSIPTHNYPIFRSQEHQAIRAMKEAARTWGDVHEQYLRAVVTFVNNFNGWTF